MNQRKTSARFYLFEDLLWEMPAFAPLKRMVSIAELQLYAGYIWAREGRRDACPLIRPRSKRAKSSYYLDGRIHLCPKHQNLGGMLHELAHALGSHDKLTHGPAFRRRCIRLYQTYGYWDGHVNWEKS